MAEPPCVRAVPFPPTSRDRKEADFVFPRRSDAPGPNEPRPEESGIGETSNSGKPRFLPGAAPVGRCVSPSVEGGNAHRSRDRKAADFSIDNMA